MPFRRYIALPIMREAVDAEEIIWETMRASFPSWAPSDADPLTILGRGVSQLYTDVAEVASTMADEAFRVFGNGLVTLPAGAARPATGVARVTARDANGPYIVPEGLQIQGRGPDGEPVAFHGLAAKVIPDGATFVDIDLEADEDGEDGNGISGAADFLEFIDYLSGVEFVGTTVNGTDEEPTETYLDRLSTELTLQSPRPIVPSDFAVLARRLAGEGYRATAIDGLDPATGVTNLERYVAVALKDAAGNPASGALRTDVGDGLMALREANFVVPMFDPTYTSIDVAAAGTALPGWDPVDVEVAAIAQVASYLSPATWGQRDDTGEDVEWRNVPLVRWGEVYEQLQRVEGMEFVNTLQIARHGDPLGGIGVNVMMAGYAPLPTAGTIAINVTAAAA